jgi:hypothetical protein
MTEFRPLVTTSYIAGADDTRPDVIEASIKYLGMMSERPRFHLYDATLDRNVIQPVVVKIHNARARREDLTLERNGFQLVRHQTTLTDIAAADRSFKKYAAELERALQDVTGAQVVFVTRTVYKRMASGASTVGDGIATPTDHVHSDCTTRSGVAMVHNLIRENPRRPWPRGRFAIYSLWRALSNPPQDIPIAVCDARSVSKAEVIHTDIMLGPGQTGPVFEGMSFRHSQRHRWLYFRDMTRDELLVIKAYDSDHSRLWRVPHTAFVDPITPQGVSPRISIDVRAVAFFT